MPVSACFDPARSAHGFCSRSTESRNAVLCCTRAKAAPELKRKSPVNPIGIHSKVFVGGWTRDEAEAAISGSKAAGFDLIERKLPSAALRPRRVGAWLFVIFRKQSIPWHIKVRSMNFKPECDACS